MLKFFLPAAFVAASLFITATGVFAQGYSGLIAEDSSPAASEKTAPAPAQDSGGYSGLIAPSAPAARQAEEASGGYAGLMPDNAPPVAAKKRAVTRAPKEKIEETPAPRDPALATMRLNSAAQQEGLRKFRKDSTEEIRNMYRISPESLKAIYSAPIGPDGKSYTELLMAKNVDFYLKQAQNPELTPEKRRAVAKDAYEQLAMLESGIAVRIGSAARSSKKYLEAGISQQSLDAKQRSDQNAQHQIQEALKILEPLQK